MKEQFSKVRLSSNNIRMLNHIQSILTDYKQQGYTLTLRQLYYQLVSRDIIPNVQKEYAKLSDLMVRARMGGIVDWDAIEDRIRRFRLPYLVDGMATAIQDTIDAYRLDRQAEQDNYLEIWIEKDALSSVFFRVTAHYGIKLMVNRGYSSCSAMYDAYQRFADAMCEGKKVHLLYFGDHDPSGLDMVRDIRARSLQMLSNSGQVEDYVMDDYRRDGLREELYDMFFDLKEYWAKDDYGEDVYLWHKAFPDTRFFVHHVALTTPQVKQYNPPPNPAKVSDPRAGEYIKRFGHTSWELDALKPEVLVALIQSNVEPLIDMKKFNAVLKLEKADKKKLERLKSI